MTIEVEVKGSFGWTTHSLHDTIQDAIDQADMVHGRVVCDDEVLDSLSIEDRARVIRHLETLA